MDATQREQVRSNALYLRRVRPIDPEAVAEYVEGQPHPAAVAQVLRESAIPLAIVEREDGTFVPANADSESGGDDGSSDDADRVPPVDPAETVTGLPPAVSRALEDLLVDRLGPGWPTDDAGEDIRTRLQEVKERYFADESVEYDETTALAYALYHLPSTFAAGRYVLAGLLDDGLVGQPLRVLDVGAGVGGPALALFECLPDDVLVEYHAVEPSSAADVLSELLATAGRNVHTEIHRERAQAVDLSGAPALGEALTAEAPAEDGFDLVLFGNVLNELDDPATVLERFLEHLTSDGTVVAIEPADREAAIGLRNVERAVADDGPATVYAPTVRLWPHRAPSGRCWSFDVKPDLDVPPFQRRLQDGAGSDSGSGTEPVDDADGEEFVNVDVQYAFSLLRLDDRRRIRYTPDRSVVAPMEAADEHVTDRVDLVAVKLSHDLAEDGHPLYLIGDGSEDTDHYAVRTAATTLNRDLEAADYGDLLHLQNALVLWNDDEAAYNVVVDDETIVDRVPA